MMTRWHGARRFVHRLRSWGGRVQGVAELHSRKADLEATFGPWTAHNCELAFGVWTLRAGSVNFDEKIRCCVRIVSDFLESDLSGVRVLDVGAGEGGLSLEFAGQGATMVCVAGRRMNIAKAQFVASAPGLPIEFHCDNVRNLRENERYDIVLCFGLLYHVDAASAVRIVEKIGPMTSRLLVLDTISAWKDQRSSNIGGRCYRGDSIPEHPAGTAESKAGQPWASLDNDTSFWFSKPSLLNLLTRVGFNTMYQVASPLVSDYWNRQTTRVSDTGTEPSSSVPRVLERRW
jgi:2-polyprenyl-3-methyl-5-hydroxy-6-metoxy-1,4-benzoquinol methylase